MSWIEAKRQASSAGLRYKLLYDGRCQLCQHSVARVKIMDLFAAIEHIDVHTVDVAVFGPLLTKAEVLKKLYLITPSGRIYSGFAAFRRLSLVLPMFFVLIPLFYFPGMGIVGDWVYGAIAKNRYLFKFSSCKDSACLR